MKPVDDCISGFSDGTLLKLLLDNVPAMSPTGTHEQVNGVAASATSGNTYTAGDIVRLVAINGSAGVVFGAGPADAEDVYLAPDVPEYFHVEANTVITVFGAIVDITQML